MEGGGHAAAPAAHGERRALPRTRAGEHDAHIAHMAHSYAMYSSVTVGALGIFLGFVVYFFGRIDPARVANSVNRFTTSC